MKTQSRIYLNPVIKAPSKSQPRRHKPKYPKCLSDSEILDKYISLKDRLKDSLFKTRSQIKALKRHLMIVETELDNRIADEDAKCEQYGKAYQDGKIRPTHPWSTLENPIFIDKEIESCRESEQDRRSKSKVYVKGLRLRAGKKVGLTRRRFKRSH